MFMQETNTHGVASILFKKMASKKYWPIVHIENACSIRNGEHTLPDQTNPDETIACLGTGSKEEMLKFCDFAGEQ